MSHTPEPWYLTDHDGQTSGDSRKACLRGGRSAEYPLGLVVADEVHGVDNRARIVVCVNSLRGVKEPQALRDALDDLRCCGLDDSRIASAVRKIRDLMKGS